MAISNFVTRMTRTHGQGYIKTFEKIWNNTDIIQDVTQEILDNITAVYKENPAEYIYFITLYHIFSEFLKDISEDVLPNEALGFKESLIWNKLYDFQRDAAMSIITKLEKYNGCILADSVGLGKTFTALAVIKYYEKRNKDVLVLCPKKLGDNWNTFRGKYVNNSLQKDRFNYDVLYHTDLMRDKGTSNGIDLSRIDWANYGLIVIDESHNFRNGGELTGEDNEKENRYLRLLNRVIRKGIQTKVLMLSATPVNNRFNDLKNQLKLAYEGEAKNIDSKLNISRSIEDVFRMAQKIFNEWSNLEPEQRTTQTLQKMLDFDFFEILDSVTIARSRKQIEKHYNIKAIGKFPKRNKPISKSPSLTDLNDVISYKEIFENLINLNLGVYRPTNYILASRQAKYYDIFPDKDWDFTKGRELGVTRLTAINLMKRPESSVFAFKLTIERIRQTIESTIDKIEQFDNGTDIDPIKLTDITAQDLQQYDFDDQNTNFLTIGKKINIDLKDLDRITWLRDLKKDEQTLCLISLLISDITPEHDSKLQELLKVIKQKIQHPINKNNKKILIFSAFADTVEYLYKHISPTIKEEFGLNCAMITGSIEGKTTISKLKSDLNTVLTCFSPISKEKQIIMPNNTDQIDILIATDCISEGQNLQDCDYLINYDIHWNPVRIIQRFGRIDRIGSQNDCIQLVNFWPNITLDEYINLKTRIETRMKIVDMTATGDDNILSDQEKSDIEYRRKQLEKLKTEIVDLEDITGGISIMDLGLNEFRLDLLSYIKQNPQIKQAPLGLHTVVNADKDGIIFVLKNINKAINIQDKNRLHPFYIIFIGTDGQIITNHLEPKTSLDTIRQYCYGQTTENKELCKQFNDQTDDGKNMKQISELLQQTIKSIITDKEQNDLESLFIGQDVDFMTKTIKGLDDFELISFIACLKTSN